MLQLTFLLLASSGVVVILIAWTRILLELKNEREMHKFWEFQYHQLLRDLHSASVEKVEITED